MSNDSGESLSKRELVAAIAFAGVIAEGGCEPAFAAEAAFEYADKFLAEAERQRK